MGGPFRGGRGRVLVAVAVLAAVPATTAASASVSAAPAPPPAPRQFVLSPEGNHLWAYDVRSEERQLLIRGVNAEDPGVPEPGGPEDRRDINGQICVAPDGEHFISGEDTVLAPEGGGDGSGSHDPGIAGWGWFEITGDRIGQLEANQAGKLAPETGPVPPGEDGGYAGDPDNYGCGFLDENRLLTTAIGDTLPGQPATGQLFLWFGPFDAGFRAMGEPGEAGYYAGEVAHCEIDRGLATAGGIAVDDNGDVYVATNRPDDDGRPGGVWRYRGDWPDSLAECTDEYLATHIRRDQLLPTVKAGPLPPRRAPTPSAVAISPWDTLFVSSVFTGTVSEYTKNGAFVRDVFPASPVAPRTGPTGDTPYGIAFSADGSLWIADLGIVLSSPVPGLGSVRRVRFDASHNPQRPESVADGLTFPDGLGVYTAVPGKATKQRATSEWGCGDWGMFGRTLSRQFSSDCPSSISPNTVSRLRPAWYFRPEIRSDDTSIVDQTTFTTAPTVVDGIVYIGGWDGHMYALDADTGAVVWATAVETARGATYGPIVSSAAVADVTIDKAVRRLVVFGAGPRLYALDADDGSIVWEQYFGGLPGDPNDPAEIASSPAIWNDVAYVGMDVHNKGGDETGGVTGGILAVDVRTGALRWKYSSEADGGHAPSGCGGVWGSPIVDPDTGRLYFGTANCPAVNDDPALPMEEVTALDARSGARLWTFRPHDPAAGDLDEDFGATPNLFVDADGRKVLGAGSKDGSYYALDPDTGEVLWNIPVVEPAPGVGGFIGATAAWDGRVFGATAIGTPPYYHSFDASGAGALAWQGAAGPSYGASAVTNGVVFAPALDSTLKAFDADTGQLLWASPLSGPGSSGPVIAGDMVFVGAGTSTSDLCAKGRPGSELCFLAFDTLLGQQGGVHAFVLDPPQEIPSA